MTTDNLALLRAALAKVDAELTAATPGPWFMGYNYPEGASVFAADRNPPADHVSEADATLIVTSVNLLQVVRDILADAVQYLTMLPNAQEQDHQFPVHALRLARAIITENALA